MLILITALLFILIACVTGAFGYHYYAKPGRLLDQLSTSSDIIPTGLAARRTARKFSFASVLEPLGNLFPISPQDSAMHRRDLVAAGFRGENAVTLLYGIKFALCVSLVAIALLIRGHLDNPMLRVMLPVLGGGLGYLLPSFALGRLISKRNELVRLALPDVLDLLVICTEAGCGLDQAMINVSRELKNVHPAIAEELSLVTMEIMAGKSRSEALKNFARRSGEDELKKIVAILVQTDRFGTSVADALRTQSDYLRIRRRQSAEERAGKVGVKLVFPIFFFCLPSLLVVTAGAGMLQLFRGLAAMGAAS